MSVTTRPSQKIQSTEKENVDFYEKKTFETHQSVKKVMRTLFTDVKRLITIEILEKLTL